MNQNQEPPQIALIEAAFRETARDVLRVARQTGTPVIVWENGRIREIPCDSPELEAWADKPGKPTDQAQSDRVDASDPHCMHE
jgi:hypothetical protein